MESPSSVKKRRFTIDGLAYLELDFLRLYWILGFWVRFIAAGTDLSAEGLCLGCERRQCGSLLCDSRDYVPTKCDYGSAEATTSSSTRVQATSRMDVLKKRIRKC
ncbi:uncharacterized protein LOC110872619 isoform X2 [Helianthus annuus]|uniref:uncharacterized protein LOC110872619 isoform X2 n=1 Tax=Helianthus annuus TaxID=4232 RepID=UPI000B8F933D|nr:uncharacterized protein LOC110872619 isoform X2 [Helianthus annuus]